MTILREERIGNQRLILGDCREVLPTLGPVDAVVTDPPYEFSTAGAGIFRSNRKNMDQIEAAGLNLGFDHTVFRRGQFASVVFFCHNDQLAKIIPYVAAEFDRWALCAWHKTNPMPVANRHYQPDTEFWVHAWTKAAPPQGPLSSKGRFYFGPGGQDTSIDHPTVKPMPLMAKIVNNVAGASILDPFMGSGTTLVACQKMGRSGTGIEIDPQYFDVACRRVEEAARQPNMFISEHTAKPAQEAFL